MPTQPPNSLATTALTTLDQQKLWSSLDDLDATQNDRLTMLINSASSAVAKYAQREFVSTLGTGTRIFPVRLDGYVSFGAYDLQTITQLQVDTDAVGVPTTITSDAYQLVPLNTPEGVYRGLRFYTFAVGPILRVSFGIDRQVSVTGTWGFPSVPLDVEMATNITADAWYKRYMVAWSQELPEPRTGPGDGLSLPYDARVLLNPYKRFA